ncbi:PhzF family phenazine biosynthesis protein [Ideonella paludis]|uniref:PhzF family phenazine biosynthesis protein n=1 Tax=Ideonella paludis TaxID=1233411 RepID=A0ABS5E270_9BURK|nr:PhzF family phenazine biosynthesis protein [Ideonella paludis]MBQ0937477.1 PhzF family phenazine biosynthesis protein [Ideonella paludis]
MLRRFSQLDVFTSTPTLGNALAVVHDADGLSEAEMAAFARWTNLSETTFLLQPTDEQADYRVRIFTPGGELPFAGHPTLGSCYAWLAAGGLAKKPGQVVQQCGVGLVRVKRDGTRLAFAAPPLRRSGPADASLRPQVCTVLGVADADLLALEWVDNGPGWLAAKLASAQAVLALKPNFAALQGLNLGVVGAYPEGSDCQFEVRAFVPELGVPEDPVTGSLNASLAQWLIGSGQAPAQYRVSQGTCMGRQGRVYVQADVQDIWIGGHIAACISGTVILGNH